MKPLSEGREIQDVNVSLHSREMRVGQCGGCGLEIRFWPQDGTGLTCPDCGVAHEVECDEVLDLTTGEKTNVVLLVAAVEWKQDDGRVRDTSVN